MKKENGYWIDEKNNSWNATKNTREQSAEKSKTLTNCRGCIDCRGCSGCSDCRGCRGCRGCIDCIDCSGCSDCRGCSGCSGCSSCSSCRDCRDCSYFKSNPSRLSIIDIGSRNGITTIYWLCDTTQVICGCFNGTLLSFEDEVVKNHKNNEHAKRYLAFISLAWEAMSI